jgi:DNA-binding HxlR family transcriptional regulator
LRVAWRSSSLRDGQAKSEIAVALSRRDENSGNQVAVERVSEGNVVGAARGRARCDGGGIMTRGDERLLRGLYDLKYLFRDKWAPAILITLSDGPRQRKEILSTISSYSIDEEWSDKHSTLHDSILARTLKKMTEEGLLTRERHTETFPARVIYSLKPEVLEFLSLTEPLIEWTERYPELIAQAQTYARNNGDDTDTLNGSLDGSLGVSDDYDDEDL